MKIIELKQKLDQLEQDHGNIDYCDISFRYNWDGEIYPVNFAFEDLFDSETNSKLETIILLHEDNNNE